MQLSNSTAIFVVEGAFLFGIVYAAIFELVDRYVPGNGYTFVFVTIGVLATLGLSALIVGVQAAAWTGLLFLATGLPMAIGAMWRNLRKAREAARADAGAIRQNVEDGN